MVLWSMFQQVMSLVCALEAPIGPLALGGRDCSVHSQQATEYQRARRKSPYEQAYGKQATVEYLRVYGCMACVLIYKDDRVQSQKMHPRA